MGEFEARYGGRCGVCDEPIHVGDSATYVDDEIAHAACPEPSGPLEPCERCYFVPAVNGKCGCDE